MVGENHSVVEKARSRLIVVWVLLLLLFIVVGVRVTDLAFLSFIDGDNIISPVVERENTNKRGDILDRNGVLLATSLRTASLYVDPAMVADKRELAQRLVQLLPDLSFDEVIKKLNTKGRFVWIKRNLTPDQHYAVNSLGYPSLKFKYEEKRIYPQGELTSHMVGYTNIDGYGLAGIEASYNKSLQNAKNIKLSLDVRIQNVLADELNKIKEIFKSKAAMGLIMDVRNGEVMAAVSLPSFDPHKVGTASKYALFNRITLGVYEMGSTFKIFSTAAQLEFIDGRLAQWFDARKSLKRGRFTIADYHAEKRNLSVPEVFIHSSNIGAALMGEAIGTQRLRNFYADLGLLSAVDFDVAEMGMPIIPNPWRDINTLTASYGHGIAVSPLHLGVATSAIVNGGIMVKPTLTLKEEQEDKDTPQVRVISEETSKKMRQLMRLTVTEGTASNADIKGYVVGGKTGTAEKATSRGYDRKRLLSSFIGVFPMNDPQYLVLAIFDEPKGYKGSYGYATGGWTGAPCVGRVIARVAPILSMVPQDDYMSDITKPLLGLLYDKKIKQASY